MSQNQTLVGRTRSTHGRTEHDGDGGSCPSTSGDNLLGFPLPGYKLLGLLHEFREHDFLMCFFFLLCFFYYKVLWC